MVKMGHHRTIFCISLLLLSLGFDAAAARAAITGVSQSPASNGPLLDMDSLQPFFNGAWRLDSSHCQMQLTQILCEMILEQSEQSLRTAMKMDSFMNRFHQLLTGSSDQLLQAWASTARVDPARRSRDRQSDLRMWWKATYRQFSDRWLIMEVESRKWLRYWMINVNELILGLWSDCPDQPLDIEYVRSTTGQVEVKLNTLIGQICLEFYQSTRQLADSVFDRLLLYNSHPAETVVESSDSGLSDSLRIDHPDGWSPHSDPDSNIDLSSSECDSLKVDSVLTCEPVLSPESGLVSQSSVSSPRRKSITKYSKKTSSALSNPSSMSDRNDQVTGMSSDKETVLTEPQPEPEAISNPDPTAVGVIPAPGRPHQPNPEIVPNQPELEPEAITTLDTAVQVVPAPGDSVDNVLNEADRESIPTVDSAGQVVVPASEHGSADSDETFYWSLDESLPDLFDLGGVPAPAEAAADDSDAEFYPCSEDVPHTDSDMDETRSSGQCRQEDVPDLDDMWSGPEPGPSARHVGPGGVPARRPAADVPDTPLDDCWLALYFLESYLEAMTPDHFAIVCRANGIPVQWTDLSTTLKALRIMLHGPHWLYTRIDRFLRPVDIDAMETEAYSVLGQRRDGLIDTAKTLSLITLDSWFTSLHVVLKKLTKECGLLHETQALLKVSETSDVDKKKYCNDRWTLAYQLMMASSQLNAAFGQFLLVNATKRFLHDAAVVLAKFPEEMRNTCLRAHLPHVLDRMWSETASDRVGMLLQLIELIPEQWLGTVRAEMEADLTCKAVTVEKFCRLMANIWTIPHLNWAASVDPHMIRSISELDQRQLTFLFGIDSACRKYIPQFPSEHAPVAFDIPFGSIKDSKNKMASWRKICEHLYQETLPYCQKLFTGECVNLTNDVGERLVDFLNRYEISDRYSADYAGSVLALGDICAAQLEYHIKDLSHTFAEALNVHLQTIPKLMKKEIGDQWSASYNNVFLGMMKQLQRKHPPFRDMLPDINAYVRHSILRMICNQPLLLNAAISTEFSRFLKGRLPFGNMWILNSNQVK